MQHHDRPDTVGLTCRDAASINVPDSFFWGDFCGEVRSSLGLASTRGVDTRLDTLGLMDPIRGLAVRPCPGAAYKERSGKSADGMWATHQSAEPVSRCSGSYQMWHQNRHHPMLSFLYLSNHSSFHEHGMAGILPKPTMPHAHEEFDKVFFRHLLIVSVTEVRQQHIAQCT